MDAAQLLAAYARGERDFSSIAVRAGVGLRQAHLCGINLSSADLRGADLRGADLSGSDLRAADLTRADLRNANLVRANLSDANLVDACLLHADLLDADLSEAKLMRVDLRGADLCGATMRGARLDSANLTGADFTRVKLAGAEFAHTILGALDLSELPEELKTVSHGAASVLGTSTLALSKGRLPKEFLRGCGLADWEVEYAQLYQPDLLPGQVAQIATRIHELRAERPIQYYSVFISHSHADKAFARMLHDELQNHGIRCWLDERQLLPGDDIHDRIADGILQWDKVILCASKSSLESWWVDAEIEEAFHKEQRLMSERGKKVLVLIPLALDGYLFEGWKNGKANQVKARMAGCFEGWQHVGFDMQRATESLIRALRADGGGRDVPPVPRL